MDIDQRSCVLAALTTHLPCSTLAHSLVWCCPALPVTSAHQAPTPGFHNPCALCSLENNPGLLVDRKTLYDGQGRTLLLCKKTPLSLAKWTIRGPGGEVLAKTRTVPGQWTVWDAWVCWCVGHDMRQRAGCLHVMQCGHACCAGHDGVGAPAAGAGAAVHTLSPRALAWMLASRLHRASRSPKGAYIHAPMCALQVWQSTGWKRLCLPLAAASPRSSSPPT